MKILLIIVRSDFGGGPRHVNQLIDNLPDGCELYLAYPEIGDPYAEIWKKNERIKDTFYIPYRKFSIKTLFELRSFVRNNKIEIIHSHGNGAGIYSRFLKLMGVKVNIVHTFHGITDEYSSKVKYLLSLIVGRMLSSFAEGYIAVSNGEKALGIKLGFCKNGNCQVIYNGIKDEGIGIKNYEQKEIITISRYDYQKNMRLCLDIVRLMKDENVRFIWVGDGEDFAEIKEAVEREKLPVDMVGFQTEPMEFLKKATVYLSTSRFEGLPYALIEAASVGIPIVATDVKGNNEVAINGENGITFKTADEGASALQLLLNDKQRYDQMCQNSRRLYEQKFTINAMVEGIMRLYKSLLDF